ncbi:MAG TPA: hypothetical protein H9831_08350 [Candidatus Eisenbergiella pullistercoris]|uniref:Transposase, YhgA-like n=2 Tax=Eisenbergiella TaxID=1432051 RepID=A0A9D2C7P2_9FIRM|nr:hypothetical protein [Candidatus Eisenbergiella pullistercoris]
MNEELYANRKHKDTVFRMLYSDKRAILELYNALNGTDYQNPDDLTVTTLENAVYMAMKNDVSFLLDERMTLYEHQSTWNPNMPLRDLLYIARLMEKSVNKRSLYQSELIKIPTPHFVVFYNGKEKKPEDTTIKLSDAFLQKEKEPELELKVRYLNINRGCNPELMERCRTLREYSEFVARIRKYAVGETAIGEAVDRAVTECIEEGILADFLSGQRAEVIAMSIFEYNEEEEMKKLRRGEQEIGERRGKVGGKAESVLEVLALHGQVPEYVKSHILAEDDMKVLSAWLREAAKAESVEDFLEKTGLKESCNS